MLDLQELELRESPSGWSVGIEAYVQAAQKPLIQEVGLYRQYESEGIYSPQLWYSLNGNQLLVPGGTQSDYYIHIGQDGEFYGQLGQYEDGVHTSANTFAMSVGFLYWTGRLDGKDIEVAIEGWQVMQQEVQLSDYYFLSYAEQVSLQQQRIRNS